MSEKLAIKGSRPLSDEGRWQQIRLGAKNVLPASLAVMPLGLALGVLLVRSGLPWWSAPLLAGLVFAGSLEFLLIGLLAAVAPLSHIALTTLVVNFRHVFYAISFPLHRVKGQGAKFYSMFALTDEAYALTLQAERKDYSSTRILAIQSLFHASWTTSVLGGSLLGAMIPESIRGLEFAVTALFAVLAIEAFKAYRSVPLSMLALISAVAASWIAPQSMMVVAMAIFLAGLAAAYLLRRRTGTAQQAGGQQAGEAADAR
ncbi:4-azaleucine resistance transporter AzlC [Arthrobacter sp. JUb119]|uniref:AzlC family ABC transporter permease n=1 Tax=Micrococcaceae TaxID=1268 RepID=UPI000CFAFFB9|nr:AzlC family ABC transporter permease [Arthrobacter sp. MYb222]MCS3494140.1 4-azaleucine resistance transporter AzlC [Arthrobacter sp. JUb119]PQZ85792.1 branched-chain amino acid ABC transporter permease [Arthrobacter sp. MYb222]